MFALGLSYCVACPAFAFDQDRQVETTRTGRTLWIGSDGGEEAEGMVRKYVELIQAPGEGVWRSRFTFWGQSRERGEASWNFNVRGLHQMFQELAEKESGEVPYRLVVIDTLKSVMD